MNENLRYLFAGALIFLIIILQPAYLKWLGYEDPSPPQLNNKPVIENQSNIAFESKNKENVAIKSSLTHHLKESHIIIKSPLYTVKISNKGGGTIQKYLLTEKNNNNYKYVGGYLDNEVYNFNSPVSLIQNNINSCSPCLGFYNDVDDKYNFINQPFYLNFLFKSSNNDKISINVANNDTIYIDYNESISLNYILYDNYKKELIKKDVTFLGDSYISNHDFQIINKLYFKDNYPELIWANGLRPTEIKENEDIEYGSGIIGQAGEVESIQSNDPEKNIQRTKYNGQTDWVAVRSKYFLSALILKNPGSYATLSSKNVLFGQRLHTPSYNVSIGVSTNVNNIPLQLYLGPLDIDHISTTQTNLDETMNWGWIIIRPISKGILWVLKFMHNTLHLNYGLVLLLFALIVRIITGPLTKKSFESSQKMQKIQPQIKQVQAKYKKDPQRLNKEMMNMYKKHGVNPLGGCLPMLLQMPLLMALFIVFRSTIEFRGQPFVFWIKDLSKPDIVLNLPFSIPIYGDGIAILPLLMGATLFLTMKMSSATMDSTQKPVMYIMNGFFILLFNSFPSGLNLYYTAYNIMSFLQQRDIRKKLSI